VTSHTGAMAGADAVYDAAFRRAGMLRVFTLDELFAAAETLGSGQRIAGDRLTILTNGGGIGILATDELAAEGGKLADLSPGTLAALEAARPHLLRIVGPNCLGIMVPSVGLNASFAHIAPRKGNIAVVVQSGAVITAMLDWAAPRAIGFSHFVSVGDMCDVDFGDLIDYLANDGQTSAILLYIEAVTNARKFISAARAASRLKPVIASKAGRHAESARAAASHTGALAGADAVYTAAFRRAGMLRVHSLDELFDAVETLSSPLNFEGERLAILSNGGGVGVLATDALIDLHGRLAELTGETTAKLDAVLPKTWSHADPVDIVGDAPPERYAKALAILLEAPEVDAVLVLNVPTAMASSRDAAEAVAMAIGNHRRPVFTSWMGAAAAETARELFAAHRIPTYETPDKAVRGFMHVVRHRRNQALLMETVPSVPKEFACAGEEARAAIGAALAERRELLTEPESKRVLACYGIPVARTLVAADEEAAARAAAEIGGQVALKILSRDISHKSDVGGVALDLAGAEAVREAAAAMRARIAKARPGARLDGFAVQEMVRRPGAHELILGMSEDRQFGPVILFGHGGTAVEVIDDKALALPPLNMTLARDLMARTRVYNLLRGYRDRRPAALDAIALTLVQLSQLVVERGEVVELDINPLLADADGVIALDARIRVRPGGGGAARLAVRPYPQELEETIALADGGTALLRPVRPEDEPAFHTAFERLSPEDIRLRFFGPVKEMTHEMAARLTQIDYEREMAFVLVNAGELLGVVRLAADPDNVKAEFAVIVRSDLKGQGLGLLLMQRLIAYARGRGISILFGDVLQENVAMLALSRELGFAIDILSADAGILRATLKL
ncbi:MAG: GNAT family N-acetyltransferase, partial [Proteobacteria bacterium]|nr:GNAT family N-acetyltransferase [Pseudomonadota bacterium]